MGSNSKPSDNPRRLAPPSLFVGPPSRNTSESALDTRITPLERERSKASSGLAQTQSNASSSPSASSSAATSPESSTKPAPLLSLPARPSLHPRSSSTQSHTHPARSPSRTTPPLPLSSSTPAAPPPRKPSATTATWRALQSTLEEVELSALSGASVFGAEHFRALEDLRNAQVELARAWARGEGDDVHADTGDESHHANDDDVFGEGGQIGSADGAAGPASAPAVAAAVAEKTGASGIGGMAGMSSGAGEETDFKTEKTRLEAETENDIRLARKRRVANDRYFERVNRGVVDVVAKLEAVASKMGGVEMSSQEIWGDEADSDGGSSPLEERT